MKSYLLLLLVLAGCGTFKGPPGPQGDTKVYTYTSQVPRVIATLELSVDPNLLPWEAYNITSFPIDGYLELPLRFTVNELLSTTSPQGGWIEIKLLARKYCYQRDNHAKSYSFKYTKQQGTLTACSDNNDKDLTTPKLLLPVTFNDTIQIIPSDPKLSVDFIMYFNIYQ